MPYLLFSFKIKGKKQKTEVQLSRPSLNVNYWQGPLFSIFLFFFFGEEIHKKPSPATEH